jgi:hypothetical protein
MEKKKLPQEVGYHSNPIYRAGRSRGIISNDEDNAESGKITEARQTGPV